MLASMHSIGEFARRRYPDACVEVTYVIGKGHRARLLDVLDSDKFLVESGWCSGELLALLGLAVQIGLVHE